MKLIWTMAAVLTIDVLVSPAHAVPPTAMPSPGYDARLQESRQGSASTIYTPAPRPPRTKPKRPAQH